MLLPVLPGPKIIFRPVHEKSLANIGNSSANFQPQSLLIFFFSGPFWGFWLEFRPPGNTGCCPATHPTTSPFPFPFLSALPSLAALQYNWLLNEPNIKRRLSLTVLRANYFMGQSIRDRTAVEGHTNSQYRHCSSRKDDQNMTGQDSWDRITKTGQHWQDRLEWSKVIAEEILLSKTAWSPNFYPKISSKMELDSAICSNSKLTVRSAENALSAEVRWFYQ
jgi:hypothetical protein